MLHRKRILLITDVYGWGGHTRGKYIKKYLEPEYDIRIMDSKQFNEWEWKVNRGCFTDKDLRAFRHNKEEGFYYNFEKFKRFVLNRNPEPFDLYYFLFHTMLIRGDVRSLLNNGAKVITIVTGYPTLKPCFFGSDLRSDKAVKKFLRLSRNCTAIGSNNIKSLKDLKTIYNGETFYAPRGVDSEIFYPMNTIFKRKEDESKFTVAYVGKPVPEKGLEEFIRPACNQAGVRIIINDRNYKNALSPEEMNKFYNQADAYVVASTIDGTPNPALEAASCGKPIISNEIGNMPEFIRDGENGFLIPGDRDMRKYANKLKWMKVNQRKTFEMGQEARKDIEKNWTWARVINTHEKKVFQEALESNPDLTLMDKLIRR